MRILIRKLNQGTVVQLQLSIGSEKPIALKGLSAAGSSRLFAQAAIFADLSFQSLTEKPVRLITLHA
jgi:hypothetical protein